MPSSWLAQSEATPVGVAPAIRASGPLGSPPDNCEASPLSLLAKSLSIASERRNVLRGRTNRVKDEVREVVAGDSEPKQEEPQRT